MNVTLHFGRRCVYGDDYNNNTLKWNSIIRTFSVYNNSKLEIFKFNSFIEIYNMMLMVQVHSAMLNLQVHEIESGMHQQQCGNCFGYFSFNFTIFALASIRVERMKYYYFI